MQRFVLTIVGVLWFFSVDFPLLAQTTALPQASSTMQRYDERIAQGYAVHGDVSQGPAVQGSVVQGQSAQGYSGYAVPVDFRYAAPAAAQPLHAHSSVPPSELRSAGGGQAFPYEGHYYEGQYHGQYDPRTVRPVSHIQPAAAGTTPHKLSGASLQRKTYRLNTIRADHAEAQLRAMLDRNLAPQTVILTDVDKGELFVQGPPQALQSIDTLLPLLDTEGNKITVGVLPGASSLPLPTASSTPSTVSTTTLAPNVPAPMAAGATPHVSPTGEFTMPSAHPTAASPMPQTHPDTHTAAGNHFRPAIPAISPMDVPEVAEASSPAVYRCRADMIESVERKLRADYGSRADVAIKLQRETRSGVYRLGILAPDSIQAAIARSLREQGCLLPDAASREEEGMIVRVIRKTPEQNPDRTSGTPSEPGASSARAATPQALVHVPRNVTAAHIEQTLRQLLAARLRESGSPGQYVLTHKTDPNRATRITVDPVQTSRPISVLGDMALSEQLLVLIREIDRPEPPSGRQRRFITIQKADPETIRQILEANSRHWTPGSTASRPGAVRSAMNGTLPGEGFAGGARPLQNVNSVASGTLVASNIGKKVAASHDNGSTTPQPPIRLVGYAMQEGGLDLGGGEGGFDPNAPQGTGMEVIPDFRYQVIPDLDVIVIDATGAEVKRFEDMIRSIERLMGQRADPQIEIFYLKHVDCVSLRWAVQDVLAPIFRTKQGLCEILPLVNPNAILLVGWGQAFDTMKDLFETLDQPVLEEHGKLKTIKLKHVSATQALTTIRGIFPPVAFQGSGFAPRINVLADRRSNALIVQAAPNDFTEIERIVREIDVSHTGPTLQVQRFRLKNTLAADMERLLLDTMQPAISGTGSQTLPGLELLVTDEHGRRMIRSGIMQDVRVSRDVQHNMIIVTGPEHCMELMGHLIEMLDAPNATAVIKVFRVLYGDAASMVNTLKALIPTQLDGLVGPMLPGAREEDALVPVRFATDSRTNSIIASGALGDLEIVEGLLLSLDREEEQARRVKVYQLQSTQAAQLADAVNEYLRAKRIIQDAAPGAISAYERLESEVVVIPEATRNALIVSATPRYYDEIIEVIKELDQQPPQVLIQVLIAEVTLGDTRELGAELGFQDSVLFDRNTFSSQDTLTRRTTTTNSNGVTTVTEEPYFASGSPGFNFNDPNSSMGNGYNPLSVAGAGSVASQLLTNFATGRVSSDTNFGGVVFSASSESINIMIRAMQESRRLEVLSKPQIMAMDNQSAFIHVGQDVPRIGKSVVTDYGIQGDVTMVKVGLLLMVNPRISADDRVVMEVTAVKSSLDTTDDGVTVGYSNAGQPLYSQRVNVMMTMTNVSTADNETVMLSGLITKEHQKINRKVPLLGDIPVLKHLFRYDFNKTRRTELLVILTPRIVRNDEDARCVKQIEAARMSWCLPNVMEIYDDPTLYDVGGDMPVVGSGVPVLAPGVYLEDDLIPLEQLDQQPVLQEPSRPLSQSPSSPRTTFPTPTLPPKSTGTSGATGTTPPALAPAPPQP